LGPRGSRILRIRVSDSRARQKFRAAAAKIRAKTAAPRVQTGMDARASFD